MLPISQPACGNPGASRPARPAAIWMRPRTYMGRYPPPVAPALPAAQNTVDHEQIGDGDRSGRIRTYNFPQGRVTDHRIGLTLYKLENILQGEINELVDELTTYFQAQALQNAQSNQPTAS